MSVGYTQHRHDGDPGSFGNACRGKVRYRSLKQARGAARVLARDTGATTLNAYRCWSCRYAHVGNTRKRKGR